jgi:hypothetical protein
MFVSRIGSKGVTALFVGFVGLFGAPQAAAAPAAGGQTDIKAETVPNADVVEIGVCLEDLDYEDFDIEGFDPDLDVEAYCLARCKGYKVYFLASEDTMEIGDEDAEDECKDAAKVFCKDVFGRRLKDSCLGLPVDDL